MEVRETFDRLCQSCKSLFNDEISECIRSDGSTPYTGKELPMTLGALIRSAEEGSHLSNILYRIFCLYAGNRLQDLGQHTKLTAIAMDVPTPSGRRLSIHIDCDTPGVNYTSAATISRVVSILGLNSLDPEGVRSITDDRVVNEKDRKSASTPSGSSAKAIRLFYKADQGLDHAVYRESWPL